MTTFVSSRLPDFPSDQLTTYAEQRARAHADGIVDLSVGTPVDPTRRSCRKRCESLLMRPATRSPSGGRDAAGVRRLARPPARRHGLGLDGVIPSIGSKELIAALPTHLGLGPADLVVYPPLAYPTYEVGRPWPGHVRSRPTR